MAAIAKRFGISERLVEQRLRLGNAAPVLLDAYRAEEIDLETLMAFAVTTDHARQMAVWTQVKEQGYRPSAWQLHRSHLPLKTWFMAVHIVTSHSNGISALQLQAQLGLGSYKSAWLLLHKLRRAMVDPDRSLLEDLVEIDEATLPFRTAEDPPTGGQGRSPQGKMRIAGAVDQGTGGAAARRPLGGPRGRSAGEAGARAGAGTGN